MKPHLLLRLISPLIVAAFSLTLVPLAAAQTLPGTPTPFTSPDKGQLLPGDIPEALTPSEGRSTPLTCDGSPYNIGASDVSGLIDAILCANASAGDDVINLTTSTYTLTSGYTSDTTTGLPHILTSASAGTLTINGSGAIIQLGGTADHFRIFYVNTGGELTINQLTVNNAQNPSGLGGGFYNLGTLTLIDSTVVHNTAAEGGAIANGAGATASVINSTLSNNTAINEGGAISNPSATLYIISSTISGNSVTTSNGVNGGGAVKSFAVSPVLKIYDSTITLNSAADIDRSGLYVGSGDNTIVNTIISGNSNGDNCNFEGGTLITDGDLEDGVTCNFGLNANPMLGPLADNGGPTKTHALMPGSPAINAGDDSQAVDPRDLTPLTTDQRGYARRGGNHVDIGAYEEQTCYMTFPYTVPNGDTTSLIDAINCANSTSTDETINLATGGTYTLTSGTALDSTTGLPHIITSATAGTLTLNGNGASIVRSGASSFRLFYVNTGSDLTLNDLLLSNGALSSGGGGGIFTGGTLTLNHVRVVGNAANYGAGIDNSGGTLTIVSSELSGNTAGNYGGALENSSGTLNLINSTVSGNSVTTSGGSNGGGALDSYGGSPHVLIVNSTIANNTAANATRSGIWYETGTLTIQNSIVANNNGANNCQLDGISFSDGGKNIDNGTSCGFGGAVGTNTDPSLGALADNGGFTRTLALQSGSPAIDAGNNAEAVDQNGDPLTTDQRGSGFPRIVGGTVDIGAYEFAVACYTLTTAVSPSGGGTVSVYTPSNCSGSGYTIGTVVTIHATANPDYSFDHWSGGTSGSTNTVMVTMNGNKTVTANFTAPTVLTVGHSFEDNGGHINYVGAWGTSSGGSFSGGTMHFTGSPGASLSFPLIGTAGNRLQIFRSTGPDRGNMQVCIGTGVCQTFSNTSIIPLYQQPLTILLPNAGSFTITITNQGIAGQYLDFDVVSLLDSPTALNEGYLFVDGDAGITYSGQWIADSGAQYPTGTAHYTGVPNSSYTFLISATAGDQLLIDHTMGPDKGPMRVCFSEVFACQTINNSDPSTRYRSVHTFFVPWTGTYPVTVTFTGSNGQYLDLQLVQLAPALAPLTVGNTDQENSPNVYANGDWQLSSNASYDGGQVAFTSQNGASIAFNVTVAAGDRLQILRTAAPDHGLMQLCIGVQCTTFSNYGLPIAYQQPINILMPNAGSFPITLTNLGSGGTPFMDFDSASMLSSPNPLNEGSTYQESSSRLIYSGQWIQSNDSHYSSGHVMYTSQPDSTVTFMVNGTAGHYLVLYRTMGPDKGPMEVCFSQIYNCQTIDNHSATVQYQQPISIALPWTAVYPVTVRFTGALGQYIDLDKVTLSSVQVLELPEPTATPTPEATDSVTETPTPEATENVTETPTLEATETVTPIPTEIGTETPTLEATETVVPPTDTPTPEATETVTPPTQLPTALPFPTVALPTDTPTIEPTVFAPLALPAYASMDDGAPDWSSLAGWALTPDAAFGAQGLGWQVSASNQADVLRWDRMIDLTTVLPGQAVLLSFESLLTSDRSIALVQVSTDGVNWTTVYTPTNRSDWQQEVIDLTGYAGQMIQLQFLWQGVAPSDGAAADRWQVDEVSVVAVTPANLQPTPTPTVESTEAPLPPTEAPAPTESATDQPTPEPRNAISGSR